MDEGVSSPSARLKVLHNDHVGQIVVLALDEIFDEVSFLERSHIVQIVQSHLSSSEHRLPNISSVARSWQQTC
jgi:hypothetical protein